MAAFIGATSRGDIPTGSDRVQDDLRGRHRAVRPHAAHEPDLDPASSASTGRCTNDRRADRRRARRPAPIRRRDPRPTARRSRTSASARPLSLRLGRVDPAARRAALRRRHGRHRPALARLPDQLPVAHHRRRPSGIQSAIWGTLWLMGICAVFIVPLGVATAVYLEEYADRERWWNRADRGQHPEPRRRALGGLRHPGPGLHRPRAAVARPGGAGGRPHARPARASRRDHRRPRGDPRGAAVDPGGLAGAGATQWQTIWKQVLPVLDPRHRDRRDPRAVARDRGDGAAAGHRSGRLRPPSTPTGSSPTSPRFRSRSSSGRTDPNREFLRAWRRQRSSC